MTDKELRDAAVERLKKTTTGYLKSNGQSKPAPWPEGSANWKAALDYLAQIGQAAPPPPPPSTGVTYPASYFTGPLGARNPLPPKKGAFLGAELGLGPGPAITWAQYPGHVAKREADMGRKYDWLMISDFEWIWGDQKLKWIHEHGSIPVANQLELNMSVTDVAAGRADAQIDRAADHYAAMDFVVMLRLWHEFDAPPNSQGYYTWSAVGREADYVRAWKRVVDRFKARGADNVGFWWCPNEGVRRDVINACYPGDAYVDWVGSDWYNFSRHDGGHSSPIHAGHAEFWELFDYNVPYGDNPGLQTQHERWGPRKPFVISETNTVWDPAFPLRKGDWYRGIPAAARNMEHLCGVGIFDLNFTNEASMSGDSEVDYPLSVPEVYEGFKAMARDPWFNTRS